MRALQFITDHVTFKLPYNQIYQMKTTKVLHCGVITDENQVEQVKGMTYTLNEFLGGSYNNLQIKDEVNLFLKILLFRITREKFGGNYFFVFEKNRIILAKLQKESIFFLIHLFARDILLMIND